MPASKPAPASMNSLADKLLLAARRPNIYGYVPHEKQEQFHQLNSKGRVFLGGNRSGKTVSGAVELVRAALGLDPHGKFPDPPLRLRAVTVDRKQGIEKIILPELHRWIPLRALKGGNWETAYTKDSQTIEFKNGSFIEMLTYEQDVEKHAGTSRHAVWFDEEPPQPIFDENLGRLVDTGGIWWMTCTPVEGMDFIFDFWQDWSEGKEDRIQFVQVNNVENPHIKAEEIDALFIGLSQEEREMRTTGQFRALGKKVYPQFSMVDHTMSEDDFIPQPWWFRLEAMDSGWSNPTCWLFAYVDPRTQTFYIYDEMYESRLSVADWAPRVHKKEAGYGLPLYRVGDPAIAQKNPQNGASVHSTYADLGVYIALGNNDVQQGFNRIRTLLDQKRLIIIRERCPNLLTEFPRYRYADWQNRKVASKNNQKETPVKKDDHAMDTLRYLVNAYLDWGEVAPVERLPQMNMPVAVPPGPVNPRKYHPEPSGLKPSNPLGEYW